MDTSKAALDAFNQPIIEEFRANKGVVGGPFEGATPLLLTTTGAKSGEPRLSPLAYLTIDDKMIIVGSKAGADTSPAWVHNLRANPRARASRSAPTPTTWWPANCPPTSATRPTRRSSNWPRPSATTRPRPTGSSPVRVAARLARAPAEIGTTVLSRP